MRIDKITPVVIQRFYAERLKAPRADGKPGSLSPTTVKRIHEVLRKSLNDAVEWGIIEKNPVLSAKPPKTERKELAVWGANEARRFLDAIIGHRLYAAFVLPLVTGLRRGELLGLRWRDIDLERGLITVRQTLVPTGKGILFQPTKTERSRRPVVLPTDAVRILREHKERQIQERTTFAEMYEDIDLVFCQPNGRRMDPRSFARQLNTVLKRINVPRIPPQGLRHTHATLLLATGVHPKVVSKRLGRAETGITLDTYSHILPNLRTPAATAMDGLLVPFRPS